MRPFIVTGAYFIAIIVAIFGAWLIVALFYGLVFDPGQTLLNEPS
jgi:hypothetical protein